MIKNVLIGMNVLLLAAVGYLYYHNFSAKKITAVQTNSTTAMPVDINGNRPPIAYVELDSLNENITYIRDRRKELEAEQRAIETEQENGYRGLQAQKDNFLKRGASITEAEAQQFQGKLIEQQQKIDDTKQLKSQKLSEKSFSIMDGIQKKLKEFLTEYNKEKKFMYIFTTGTGLDYMVYKDSSLNITHDVIKGMNEKMKPSAKQ
ncbi:MAG TPA: OmpH family outer membrane protein [Ferruginibacter sp.]|nr:OmpH family outer membrane protein [Ferruginibacter sp.]